MLTAAVDSNSGAADTRNISASPTDRITSSLGGYVASFSRGDGKDVDSQAQSPSVSAISDHTLSNIPANTPSSCGEVSQGHDTASEALISMRNRDAGTYETTPLSVNPYPSMGRLTDEWAPNSSVSPTAALLTPTAQTTPKLLTSKEEAELLRQFSAGVATWMDLSDLSETFSKKVCRLAVHNPLLKAAGIACAAKQQYLVGKLEGGMQIARKNYDTAISLLINLLRDLDEQFAEYAFAAIVICSCYEMLDAPTADWQRHLDGVFSVSRMQRINGSSGGISQAAFWSIARQEVACAIIHRSGLRLDPDSWFVDLENIGREGSDDLVNNQ